VRAVIAILLTLVAASSAHVTRVLACDSAADPCCCAEDEEDAHHEHAQRIAPICGCTIEPAPEHLPPPLNGIVTSATARMVPAPMLVSVALEWPRRPDPQRANDVMRWPRPPCPTCSLLAQHTSLLI
jgi:hypothetical protein